jgi:hypothetical protein
VFDRPRFEVWTGVVFGPMQSLEWLYLWLAYVLDTSLCSLSVDPAVIDAGLVEPMFRANTMAVPGERELAYLTWRLAGHAEGGGKIMEIGVNGGMGITQKALPHGVPVCIVPFGRDQLEVARRVQLAGAGTRLPASRLNARRLRKAVHETLTKTQQAQQVAQRLSSAGGADPAAPDTYPNKDAGLMRSRWPSVRSTYRSPPPPPRNWTALCSNCAAPSIATPASCRTVRSWWSVVVTPDFRSPPNSLPPAR